MVDVCWFVSLYVCLSVCLLACLFVYMHVQSPSTVDTHSHISNKQGHPRNRGPSTVSRQVQSIGNCIKTHISYIKNRHPPPLQVLGYVHRCRKFVRLRPQLDRSVTNTFTPQLHGLYSQSSVGGDYTQGCSYKSN